MKKAKKQSFFLFFRRRFDAVRASLPRRAERLRRGCVVPTTSRDRDGDLHREPRTRKRCRSSGSSARRARLDCLARMETERENAVKFDATAERRSCGRVEIFDLGSRSVYRRNHGKKFSASRSSPDRVIPSEMGVSHVLDVETDECRVEKCRVERFSSRVFFSVSRRRASLPVSDVPFLSAPFLSTPQVPRGQRRAERSEDVRARRGIPHLAA